MRINISIMRKSLFYISLKLIIYILNKEGQFFMFRLLRLLCIALSLSVWLFPVLGQETSTNQRAVRQKNVHELMGVVKEPSGEPLPGATVYLKGNAQIGTATDLNGNFVLKGLPSGKQTIVVSCIGMETKEFAYTGQKSMKIILQEKVTEVQDVVVTGIYVRKKNSFTGSATTYSKDDLKRIGTKNIIQSLKTLEPALNVIENTSWGSDPNRMPDMEIRGKTSIVGELSSDYDNTANQPLFILDGVEVTIEDIMKLPIDRIASVTVLKDAASTAIYGSKSANGVIVVETVRPEPGRLRVSYSGNFTYQTPDLTDYNLMNASEKLDFERLAGRYTAKSIYDSQDELDALYYSRLKEVRRGVNTYWLSEPLRAVLNHSHNLYIDGGDNAMVYGIGVAYSNDDGVMKGSDRETMSGNIKLSYRAKSLIFTNDFNIDVTNWDREPVDFFTFAQANPYYRKYNDDGTVPELLEDMNVAGTTIYNPLYLYNIVNTNKTDEMSLRNNFSIVWRFLNAFQLRGRVGVSKSISKNEMFKSPSHPDFLSETRKGTYSREDDDNFSYNGDLTLTYGKIFKDVHLVNLVGGWTFNQKKTQENGFMVSGFTSDLHQNPQFSAGFNQGDKPAYRNTVSRSTSFYMNGNYSFRNRYMLDANFRWDGSSVFGAQKMFTGTWAVGLGWNVNNERWFRAEWVNLLKFRFSIGNPGNQNFDAYLSSGTYIYNTDYTNHFGTSAIIEKFANKNLAWQKTIDKNFGLDLEFFDSRLRLSGDYYHKVTDPLLVSVSMPPSVGLSSLYTNFGGQVSKGVNGTIMFNAIKRSDLRLNLNLNFRHGTTEYRNIGNKLDFLNEKGSGNSYRRYYDGGSPDDIWAVRSAGIDPATGREIFIKKDGTYTFQYDANDEVVVGSTASKLEGVFGVSMYYKQFSASLNLRYALGRKVFASALYNKVENISEESMYYNLDKRALYDRWKQPGDMARFKAIDNFESTPMSSRFVVDDNVISGESISLGYETAAKWLRSIKAEGASIRLYMNDIFRLASFKEERGIEYPFSRSVSLSVDIRF